MGAAGLACCTSEMPARSGHRHGRRALARAAARDGHDAVRDPALRVAGAHAAGRRARAARRRSARVFAKWELDAVRDRHVTDGGELSVAPARARSWPRCRSTRSPTAPGLREADAPAGLARRRSQAFDPLALPEPADYEPALLALLRARRRSRRRSGCSASTISRSASTRSCCRAPTPACCASRARGARSPCRPTATAARCFLDPRRGRGHGGRARRRATSSCAGGAAARRHRLPELRLARTARDPVAVRRGDRGHRRGVPRARAAGGRRQRFLLQ